MLQPSASPCEGVAQIAQPFVKSHMTNPRAPLYIEGTIREKMMKAPWHLWVVGILALLWNAGGAFDYVMMQTQNDAYLGRITAEQRAFFDSFPTWAHATWAIAVWGSVLGAILLLVRSRFAGSVFAIAFAAMLATTFHNMVLADPSALDLMGQGALIMSGAIIVISIFLIVYARQMGRKGILR